MKKTRARPGGLLCLQSTSVFESYGGIEYYLDDLLTAATKVFKKGAVHTIVPVRSDQFALEKRPYEVHPIKVHSSGFLRKLENRASPWIFRKALEIIRKEKISVILCGHVSLGPLAFALSKWTGIPYFSMAYGIECWGAMQPQDEWAFFQSHHILSISNWTKKILTSKGMPDEKISIVAPCLSSAFESVVPRPLTESKQLRLVTISRLNREEQYKGHDHVIRALAEIRNETPDCLPHYVIQGDGDDKGRLEALAISMGVGASVSFRSRYKDRAELAELYAKTDVFIMPSRFGCWEGRWRGEGFGIVFVEAAAFGVPSIAYDCGGATDIIKNGETGLLVGPDDIAGLKAAIIRLHQDRKLVDEMGKKARERALSHFTLANTQAQLHASLQRIGEATMNGSPNGTLSLDSN